MTFIKKDQSNQTRLSQQKLCVRELYINLFTGGKGTKIRTLLKVIDSKGIVSFFGPGV